MKTFSLFLILMFAAWFSQSQNSISRLPAGTPYANPTGYQPALNDPGEVLVTHSTDQSIVLYNSVACSSSSLHTDNSYFRVFDLANDFGLGTFVIKHVEIGIETASSATGTQPVELRFYSLDVPMVNPLSSSAYFSFSDLTLLGSQSYTVADQSLSIVDFILTNPIVVPENTVLVVEFFTPNGQAVGNSLYVGSNPTGAGSAPWTFLAAPDCSVYDAVTTAYLGFPEKNMVMNVYGINSVVPFPYGWVIGIFVLLALTLIIKKRFF